MMRLGPGVQYLLNTYVKAQAPVEERVEYCSGMGGWVGKALLGRRVKIMSESHINILLFSTHLALRTRCSTHSSLQSSCIEKRGTTRV